MLTEDGSAIFMYEASEKDNNIYYATNFLAPDKFIYLKTADREVLVLSDLEIDRARSQSRVNELIPMNSLIKEAKDRGISTPKIGDIFDVLFRKFGVKQVIVPPNLGVKYADLIRDRGYRVKVKDAPFFEERQRKNAEQVDHIRKSIEATQHAFDHAIGILREARVSGDHLVYEGEVLTSEMLRTEINICLMRMGYVGEQTIVACGEQSAEPHNKGSGSINPNATVVMDLFPKSMTNGYHADMTRTVVKGTASEEVRRMFAAVLEAQKVAIDMLGPGVDGKEVHQAVVETFEKLGFKTGQSNGRMQGFFHATGHGIGLDIHEEPRLANLPVQLEPGNVITVEPGLYYPGIGGVRIEDDVLITDDGFEVLSHYQKTLEIR